MAALRAAEKLTAPAKFVVAGAAKQSRKPMESTAVCIAAPGYALLAMTADGFFSGLQVQFLAEARAPRKYKRLAVDRFNRSYWKASPSAAHRPRKVHSYLTACPFAKASIP
jgi:hypothetical protein